MRPAMLGFPAAPSDRRTLPDTISPAASALIDPTSLHGPLRVLAGPGAGKTHALASLYEELVTSGEASRSQILVLTFSTSAAEELTRRVDESLPGSYGESWISTFHSFCARLLREYRPDPRRLLMNGFQEWVVMRQVLAELDPGDLGALVAVRSSDAFAQDALAMISMLKQNLIHPGRIGLLAEATGSPRMRILARLYRHYQARLRAAHLVDFRDLVAEAITLLEPDPQLRKTLHERFRWILVDEFQDVDPAQFELLRLLAPPDRSPRLIVVGDPDQSIYGFRGTVPALLQEEFPRVYGSATLTLDRSRRCPTPILERAQRLLDATDPDRGERSLSGQGDGPRGCLQVIHQGDPLDEAFTIAREIHRLILESEGELQPSDFAILVRSTNTQAAPFQEALRALRLPHEVRGGGATRQNQVVRYLLSYLHALAGDERALERVLDSHLSGVPSRTWSRIRAQARERGRSPLKSVHEILYRLAAADSARHPLPWASPAAAPTEPEAGSAGPVETPDQPEPDALASEGQPPASLQIGEEGRFTMEELDALHRAMGAFHTLRQRASRLSLVALAHEVLIESGATQRLMGPSLPQTVREEALANLQVTLRAFADLDELEQRLSGRSPQLHDAVDRLEAMVLWSVDENEPRASGRAGVQIMTIHQAKGLEFEVVFMGGFAHGRLPLAGRPHPLLDPEEQAWMERSLAGFRPSWPAAGDGQVREEGRLAYVGMTRARQRLYLTFAESYGDSSGPSPFLELMGLGIPEIPALDGSPEAPLTLASAEVQLAALRTALGPEVATELRDIGVDMDFVLDAQAGRSFLPFELSPPGVSPHHFSATQLTDYLRCPRLYWYNHHPAVAPPPARPEMRRGGFIHQILEEFHQREDEWRHLHAPEQKRWLAAVLEPRLEEYLGRQEGVMDRKREEHEVRRVLDNYMAFATSLQRVPRFGTLAVEKRFVLQIEGAEIHGVIDRINRASRDGEECEVVDYKTGGGLAMGRAYDTYFGENMYDVQLIVYYLACQEGVDEAGQRLDLKPRFLSLWYPKDRVWGSIRQALFTVGTPVGLTQGRERVLDPEDLERARTRLLAAIAGIRAGRFRPEPKDVTGTCVSFTGCPHENICPFSRKRVE